MNKNGNSKRQSQNTPPGREKWIVATCFLGFVAMLAMYCTITGLISQHAALHNQMMEWTASYHLTEKQAARIRQIEARFHGNGNPFTSRQAGTPEENDAHHLEISRVMNPEDGAHFLHAVTLNGGRH